MKNKKVKSNKVGNKRKKVPSDISPSTSLPPLVEGQLRCFLRVTVSRVLWTVPKPPAAPLVRLRWWGESTNGTHFRPRDGSHVDQRGVKTTARFAVRCGPKQFTSYLTDMGMLVLEVLTKPDRLPIGRVQIAGIARLSLSHSISGFFTVVSPASEKLGELQVSLALEPLTETYDSNSSGPTSDGSIGTGTEAPGPTPKAAAHKDLLVVPSLSRCPSGNSGKDSLGSSSSNTPRGKDHLYFQERSNGHEGPSSAPLRPPSRSQYGEERLNAARVQWSADPTSRPEAHISAGNQTSKDILSVLLDRGSKLRNAMVVSALKSDLDSDLALKDIPVPVSKDNIGTATSLRPVPSSGKLLQNLLQAEAGVLPSPGGLPLREYSSLDCFADTENRAVELLLGSVNGSALWDGEGSPPEFLSGTSSVCEDSDLNDPLFDQSLLENLFYRASRSDSSDFTAEEDEGLSVKKKKRKRGVTRGKRGDKELRSAGGTKSGGLVPEDTSRSPEESSRVPDLTVDQLTLLGRVHLARVIVHSLTIPTDSTPATPHKTPSKGKPPRPPSTRKCSYFVEYFFPVCSTKHNVKQAAMATEVIRFASSKVAGGVVKFQQRSVFPVRFSGPTVDHWWNTDVMFKIYSREKFQQKPVPIGKAAFPLRSLLRSADLSLSTVLPILGLEEDRDKQELGTLKVTFELAADSKDFSPAKGRAAGATALSNAPTSPQRKTTSSDSNASAQPRVSDSSTDLKGGAGRELFLMPGVQGIHEVRLPTPSHTPVPLASPNRNPQQLEEEEGVLLHALLMVPDGKDFKCGTKQAPSVYLNCKLFGSDETTRSAVSWGQTDPTFNFIQVAPVVLSPRLLERMRNNVMVIEVWQKAGGSGQDALLGLAKLPLHQLYMSFRDPKISQLLLQVQYPVVAVDCYMPVIDVFSGSSRGSLRVLLAMGLAEQIVSLQRMRDEELGSVSCLPRPAHSLDQRQHADAKVNVRQGEAMTEHVFEVTVERVKGLTPLQSTVWGEADCYVQYSFPAQSGVAEETLDPNAIESSVSLRQFRTGTTLCVPDPVFGHSESHTLLAPAGVLVQKLLLSCCSSQGPATRGGIQFEVWCRYYYPNVRDQQVAKGLLPLSKLCAMVTMQTQEQMGAQAFSLPLIPRTDSPAGHQPQPSGLLDVRVQYKQRPVRTQAVKGGAVASRVVTLAVQVHRAAGLKAAARAVTRQDEAFRYYADVGVNSYVTVQLSFLPERERRSTRVVARSFCPEFEHHAEFPCSLVVQSAGGETCSLAELLEGAAATFTVCHRDSRRGSDCPASKDTVLGRVRIHLGDLIHKRTGISGWFALSLPQDPASSQANPSSLGGLEISINFAHHSDRERVIGAARNLGWEVSREDVEEEDEEEEEAYPDSDRTVSVSVSVPRVWLPLHCLLLPGHMTLERSTYCYFRYKLYEEEAFCSPLQHPAPQGGAGREEGVATVAFRGSRVVQLRATLPLLWYLREERLEVQVWVAFGKHRRPRPHDTDRLVGSAYVELSSLARRAEHKLTISGVYPLFRRSASDLEGAALRVHITLTLARHTAPPGQRAFSGNSLDEHNSQGALSSGEGEEEEEEEDEEGPRPPMAAPSRQSGTHSHHRTKSSMSTNLPPSREGNEEDTFAVTVTVDRAMHLSLKGSPLAERSGGLPSCCVSYATADRDSSITTPVVPDTDCPVWDHQWGGRLSKQILLDPQQTMVFKVWHKGDVERVIGFASVDLSPLLSGFQSVCGWYNITDFSGQCQGQLKVAVSPLKGVQNLRVQRQAAQEESPKDSSVFQTLPLCYHTTAMYSSFPTHITRYPEQRINASPDQLEALLSGSRSSLSERREEHIHNVRMFHQSLQEGDRAPNSSAIGETHPSKSMLSSALRKNLSELDDIQRYFSRKLSTPTFPSLSEQVRPSPQEEHGDSEMDTTQLLLKSNRLVGEVNSLISNIHGRHLRTMPENAQSSSNQKVPAGDSFLSAEDHFLPAEHSEPPRDRGSALASPVPHVTDEPSDFLLNVEDDHDVEDSPHLDEDEGEHKGQCSEEEEEEEEEEDYEETLIEPKTLNEVTSVTDKTSPWTSLLSEPDLGSLESLESPEEQASLTVERQAGRGAGLKADARHAGTSGEPTVTMAEEDQHAEHEPSDECDANAADPVRDAEAERQESTEPTAAAPPDFSSGNNETAIRGPSDRHQDSQEERQTISHAAEHFSEGRDVCQSETASSCAEDKESKLPDSVDVPNFFLPTHHLEASMRALRLAPVFPAAPPDRGQKSSEQEIPFRRAPRQRPKIPPSSLSKEETKRIAKIFASNFSEEK
ncbi:C2 domain-containing protein 3 isoform X1 [Megalops cyprinoides]|uniref:C2 domain-containing protein 3 isoform X1 n=1 Tax=Megalops cyprinoides TaxID=118141 RepID=UPI0018642AB6|nr:C2 domain-containing protein 3 isoform X1 [Megalops cyprinoides]